MSPANTSRPSWLGHFQGGSNSFIVPTHWYFVMSLTIGSLSDSRTIEGVYSTCFSADVDDPLGTFATRTAIIVFFAGGILIWAIPFLLPYSPDHFLDDNPAHLPPHIQTSVPGWHYLPWYAWLEGNLFLVYGISGIHLSRHITFGFKTDRFELIVKTEASLQLINTS